ncbi:MAG: ComF family protein [Deltaproteobacteria bacterium]|nr:ComF family protein [Deltaproteobacteria bacterium]
MTAALSKCIPCQKISKPWNESYISFLYLDGVRDWIQDIKSNLRPERYGELKRSHLPEFNKKYDGLVPVSSDPRSSAKKLFCSAEVLAQRVSKILKIPIFKNAFSRREFLSSQHDLNRVQRLLFLNQAVTLNLQISESLPQKILLIDDVMTTGASLEIHAKLIKTRNCEVDVFCLARTPKFI